MLATSLAAIPGMPVTAAAQSAGNPGVDPEIRETMREAFDALSFLVEAAIEPGAAPRPRAEMEAALERLEAASEALQFHGQLKPTAFSLLGRSLEDSVGRMIDNYRVGLTDVADLYLLDTVEHCVTCHSLLPDKGQRNLGELFAGAVEEASVEPVVAAHLLIAARQVPRALSLWESYFSSDDFAPGEMTSQEELADYLWHALLLTGDPERPLPVLEMVRDAEDAPFYLRRRAGQWIGQLGDLAAGFQQDAGIGEIRRLFGGGFTYSDTLAGRDHLVQDVLVSSQANQLLANAGILQAEERAELYFILALTELRSRLSVGAVPAAELYLEAAIREAPDSEIARTAYAELQQYALQYFGEPEPSTALFPVPMAELRRLAGLNQP